MPISKIKSGAINDDAISTAKIQDDAVTDPKIVDSYTTSVKTNPEFEGTEAARMPVGTTAERANAQSGDIRFNSTLSLMEYYDGTQWKSIDSPPVISSVSPDNFDTAGDTITITGSNFQSGATVKVIASDGSEFNASTVTFTNSNTVTFDITQAMVDDDDDPYDVQVTNPSGLSGTLADALDFAPEPVFDTASGSIGTIFDSTRSSYSLSAVTATSAESDATLTYALGSGDSLPAGLSLNTSSGAITGTATAVGSDTTTTFDIVATATDGDSNVTTNTRSFSITVNAPVINSYTSTGSGTFTVPSGLAAVDVLVVAGGGGGGRWWGAGGGAGGLIYRPAFPVTPGGSVPYSVGGGGQGGGPTGSTQYPEGSGYSGTRGGPSTFGTLTALAGGGGAGNNDLAHPERPGGSGGGGSRGDSPAQNSAGGTAQQPGQPGDSGTYGFGNAGGTGAPGPDGALGGGGGGGAGGAGQPSSSSGPSPGIGEGGIGKTYDISGSSVGYAGGGNGAVDSPNQPYSGAGVPFGGGVGVGPSLGPNSDGVTNRGGGGGGVYSDAPRGGNGGSGIVIVKY